ncbi:MAG: SMI1/KNR4 family protein [Pseudomonadota bacterium]
MSTIWQDNPPAEESGIDNLVAGAEFELPGSYLDLLRETNGTIGPIGVGQGRIHIYSTDELDGGLSSAIALDGFFVFGTDGAGTAFAIRMGMMDVVMVTTTAIITVIAVDFDQFLQLLSRN